MSISLNSVNSETVRAHRRIDELEDKIGSGSGSETGAQAVFVRGLDELKTGKLENTGSFVYSDRVNCDRLNMVVDAVYMLMITLSGGEMYHAPLYCISHDNMEWKSEFVTKDGIQCSFIVRKMGYILTSPKEGLQMGISLYKVKAYDGKHKN